MKRIWWTWDVRMRWDHGFSASKESYINNYKQAIDSSKRYNVDGIVIWGFLRDCHGGIDAGMEICEYADKKGVVILPGVGIDAYGGVYYEGRSAYSLDQYLDKYPEAQAVTKDQVPFSYKWPPTDQTERKIGCPSNEILMEYYYESVKWLIDTFHLKGFQIEQGDVGLCHCKTCREKKRTTSSESYDNEEASMEDMENRLIPVINYALSLNKELIIISETYNGLTVREIDRIGRFFKKFPEETYISWSVYSAPRPKSNFQPRIQIDEAVKSITKHGNCALRTNNDLFYGELDDTENIKKALILSKRANLDMTYIYGEYPDSYPKTRKNYEIWSEYSKD